MRARLLLVLLFVAVLVPFGFPLRDVAVSLPEQDGPDYSLYEISPELPRVADGSMVLSHAGFALLYDDAYRQARWVAYELTRDETSGRFKRTDRFMPDPLASQGTASDADYLRSGYDRGHLAPAADMGWSEVAIAESFYYSNISPQTPGFNRGIWKRLEERVRDWAIEYDAVYVVTGPVLTPGAPVIGPDRVAVPAYFFKVLLDFRGQSVKGIGFILPNASSSLPLTHFAVPIDSVERVTGIDFFPWFSPEQEQLAEGAVCLPCWSW